jgi:eukaryotic-like serine/threonine-protein kinase
MFDPTEPHSESAYLPTTALGQDLAPSSPSFPTGFRVGAYRLMGQIGRGGMGTVYRAVRADDEFQHQVAIKIVNRGLDSPLALDWFRTERQILAKLEHHNICRLLDGGTTPAGSPFFVMEYIEGEPLHRYCDTRKLNLRARIELFRRVCDALSYAHQHLVIHRDLKPDNVLVMADGTPKLLDFGIAKVQEFTPEDEADRTATLLYRATPAYASPEQIRGAAVGVGSDIYSLGVVLYELLTGERPYRLEALGWQEAARVICEKEPTRASLTATLRRTPESDMPVRFASRATTKKGLRKQLEGDLDNILAMALRKDPKRRYRSVEQLSDDLLHYLDGRPVAARGDSVTYRAGKYVRRHRTGVVIGVLFAVSLLSAGLFAAWKANRLAERVYEDQALATSFLGDLHDDIARLPGSTPVRERLLRSSLKYLNDLTRDVGSDLETRRSLALAYEHFAELQAGADMSGLGKPSEALHTYARSRAIREALVQEFPADREAQFNLASNYLLGGVITGRVASVDQMLVFDRKALQISQELHDFDRENPRYQSLLARTYSALAYDDGLRGSWREAQGFLRQAAALSEAVVKHNPEDWSAKNRLADVYYRIVVDDVQSGASRTALPDFQRCLDLLHALQMHNPSDVRVRSQLAGTNHFFGMALTSGGNYKEALEHFKAAIEAHAAILKADAQDVRTRSLLAGNYSEQAEALLRARQVGAALNSIEKALQLEREVARQDPQAVPSRVFLGDFEARRARIEAALGNLADAGDSWAESASIYDRLDCQGYLRSPDMQQALQESRTEAARFQHSPWQKDCDSGNSSSRAASTR